MEGQVAIVTGGAMGIGLEFVKVLLRRKLKVIIADVNDAAALDAIQELSNSHKNATLMFQHCDVTNEEQFEDVIKKTLEKFGRFDVLVNNAGILNETKYKLTIEINMTSVLTGTFLGLKYLSTKEGGSGGSIINIASIFGLFPSLVSPVYAATKHAVLGFSRSIGATSIAAHGVRINCICPSFTSTNLLHECDENKVYLPKGDFKTDVLDKLDATKLLEPSQVAECLNPLLDDVTLSGAAMLCSPEHPQTLLKLPETLEDIYKSYVVK